MKQSSRPLQSLFVISVVAFGLGLGFLSWLSVQRTISYGLGKPLADGAVEQTPTHDASVKSTSVTPSNTTTVSSEPGQNVPGSIEHSTPPAADSDVGTLESDVFQVASPEEEIDATAPSTARVTNDEQRLADVELVAEIEHEESSESTSKEETAEAGSDLLEDDDRSVENTGTEVLAGRVIDQQGLPVPGLSVTASRRADNRTSRSIVRTDSDGRFEYRDIATGEYLLNTANSDVYPSVSQYARSGTTTTSIVVSRLYRVQVVGRITSQAGQSVSGASITAPGGNAQTKSDTTGAYRIMVDSTNLKGFVLRYSASGYVEELQRVEMKAGATQAVANIILRPKGNLSVSGRVLNPESNPVQRALVQITSRQRDYHESTQTDKDGTFVLSGLPSARDYRIKASASDAYGIWQRENVEVAVPVQISIMLPNVGSGRVVGSIVDINRLPLPDYSLLAVRGGTDGRVTEFQSDSSGYFEIENIVAQKLSFISRSTPNVQISGASVSEGEQVQLTLVVNVGAYELSGTVATRGSLNPVRRARVVMNWQDGFDSLSSRVSHTTTSDADGNFRFSNLGDGEWTLKIVADGHREYSQTIQPATLSVLPAIYLDDG